MNNSIHISTLKQAIPSLLRDLHANGITYQSTDRPTQLLIEDTPKGRTAIRLVKERFGLQSIRIISK
jgi:hypothetical protein